MINPQMGNMNVPTVKELWKNEKTKYRHWILLFGIGLAAVFALYLTSSILNWINFDQLMTHAKKGEVDKDKLEAIQKGVNYQYIINPIIQLIITGLGLMYFIVTIIQSYQKKSFAHISQFATIVVGVGALFSFFNLVSLIWNGGNVETFDSPGSIFAFANSLLLIAVYFGTSRQVSIIRRQFAISERIEELKKNPMYQQQMEQMMNGGGFQNMGPFGPQGTTQNQAPQQGEEVKNPNTTTATQKPQMSKEEKDLMNMTVVQLRSVADKLEISGNDSMKKDELIKSILRVTDKK